MSYDLRACATVVVLACAAGCQPTLDDRPWRITQPQIIGWRATPAETAPGRDVALQVFALDPAGPADTATTSWTICHSRKPLDEDRVVTPDCLTLAPDAFGDPVQLTIPSDACQVFGPDTPQPAAGAPPTRPRDPDSTGGYYQPITLTLGASVAVGLQRLTCDLPDASLANARAFQAAYAPNQNPSVTGLRLFVDGAAIDAAAVPAGARITLAATWSADSAEPYARFDRTDSAVVATFETLLASWYVTGGQLEDASTAIDRPDTLTTFTTWQAPPAPGTVQLAFVLRDSRGGEDALRVSLIVIDRGAL